MPDFPLIGDGQYLETASQAANPALGTVVPGPASTNTKGSWTQLIAATAHRASWVLVQIVPNSGGADNYLVDIGIGAAGSEVVIIPNLMFLRGLGGAGTVPNFGVSYIFPLSIPAGSRLSARLQCGTASKTVGVFVTLIGSGFLPSSPLQRVTDYGSVTGSSIGTVVDPGATVETYGSWVQLSAATTRPIRFLVAAFGYHASQTSPTSWWAVDFGIGAAGSERVIVSKLSTVRQKGTDPGNFQPATTPAIPVAVPAGSRLAARCMNHSLTASPDRLVDVIAYGVD